MNKTQIVNAALDFLGEARLLSSIADDTDTAKYCNAKYAEALDELYSETFWDFSQRVIALEQCSIVPKTFLDIFAFAYNRPSDCVQIRLVDSKANVVSALLGKTENECPSFKEVDDENNKIVILSNVKSAFCLFLKKLDNPALYPFEFTNALIFALAYKIAKRITGSDDAVNKSIQMYNYYKGAAVEKSLNRQSELVNKTKKAKYYTDRFKRL